MDVYTRMPTRIIPRLFSDCTNYLYPSIPSPSKFFETLFIGDIKPDQFILAEDGKFKLNDFNKGHLMYWNTTSNTETCPYSFKNETN